MAEELGPHMAYLDDVVIAVDPGSAQEAYDRAKVALASLGLEVRPEKCRCLVAGGEQLVSGVQPVDASKESWPVLGIPVGTVRQEDIGRAMISVRDNVRLIMQMRPKAALHALRISAVGDITHLIRALPIGVSAWLAPVEDLFVAAIGLLGCDLDARARDLARLPIRLGGCGIIPLLRDEERALMRFAALEALRRAARLPDSDELQAIRSSGLLSGPQLAAVQNLGDAASAPREISAPLKALAFNNTLESLVMSDRERNLFEGNALSQESAFFLTRVPCETHLSDAETVWALRLRTLAVPKVLSPGCIEKCVDASEPLHVLGCRDGCVREKILRHDGAVRALAQQVYDLGVVATTEVALVPDSQTRVDSLIGGAAPLLVDVTVAGCSKQRATQAFSMAYSSKGVQHSKAAALIPGATIVPIVVNPCGAIAPASKALMRHRLPEFHDWAPLSAAVLRGTAHLLDGCIHAGLLRKATAYNVAEARLAKAEGMARGSGEEDEGVDE